MVDHMVDASVPRGRVDIRVGVAEVHRVVDVVLPEEREEIAAERIAEIDVAVGQLDDNVVGDLVANAGVDGVAVGLNPLQTPIPVTGKRVLPRMDLWNVVGDLVANAGVDGVAVGFESVSKRQFPVTGKGILPRRDFWRMNREFCLRNPKSLLNEVVVHTKVLDAHPILWSANF